MTGSTTSAAALAEAQLEAYNARDLDAFCACFAPDVEIYNFPDQLVLRGAEAFRARYAKRFKAPGLTAELLSRMVLGNTAIDHERIWFEGRELSTPVEAIAIYSAHESLISRVDFIREGTPQ